MWWQQGGVKQKGKVCTVGHVSRCNTCCCAINKQCGWTHKTLWFHESVLSIAFCFRLQQEAVQQQLDTLQQVLEAKEAQMARLTKGGGQARTSVSLEATTK